MQAETLVGIRLIISYPVEDTVEVKSASKYLTTMFSMFWVSLYL